MNNSREDAITHEALKFVMAHAYCADGRRAYYRDDFRRFIVELRRRHADLEMRAFAEAVQIPADIIKDWL